MDNNLNNPMFPSPQVGHGIQTQVPQWQFANQHGMEYSEIDQVRDFWYRLLKRKKWILAVFIAIVAATGLYVLLKTPVYRSAATIQITQNNNASVLGDRDPMALLGWDEGGNKFYETQYMILVSRTLAGNIIAALNLRDHQEFKKLKESYSDESPEKIEQSYVKFFLKNLEVKPMKKSYLVEVSYKSTDKLLAQNVTDAISGEYMRFAMQTRQQSYSIIKKWLEGELNGLAFKVEV